MIIFKILFWMFMLYASVIGLLLNSIFEYVSWEEIERKHFGEHNKGLKLQTIQLKLQIASFVLMVICGVICIVADVPLL